MQIILPERFGPVHINVTRRDDKVLLQFSREVLDLPMSPQEAAELARAIAEQTAEIVRKNHGDN